VVVVYIRNNKVLLGSLSEGDEEDDEPDAEDEARGGERGGRDEVAIVVI